MINRNILTFFAFVFMILALSSVISHAQDYNSSKEYAIKDYHTKIAIGCVNCHEGTDKTKYKAVPESTCLSCHISKEKVADRLAFLGGKNPHSSVHDGPNLSCHECHNSHKPSYNMCKDCHNTKNWMREIK